jgi:hypothetical protein
MFTVKKINNLKLQNTVMQLRKVCSHPFLFDWPTDPATMEPILNEELVNASGKMMLLNQLLEELFRRKHKVLLFSQFTTMLDIIHVRTSCVCYKETSTENGGGLGLGPRAQGLVYLPYRRFHQDGCTTR